jgi:tetratricopeptide (TPR) repeat protein
MRLPTATLLASAFLIVSTPGVAQEMPRIGEVDFATTCEESVSHDFNRAVALLHSFEFAQARQTFQAVSEADPNCAMAHWGVAMTYYHPLWAPPTASDKQAGAAAAHTATELASSEREAAYAEAIATFYRDHEALDHRTRAIAYEKAMEAVAEANPDDPEAALFYQLAVLSNADPRDKDYTVQKATGAFFEEMFVELPDHPGVAHYIIHSYDYPPLSAKAVPAAHRYLEIAPDLAHAVHMSGHIFTQEGMWDASIDANALSAHNSHLAAENPATIVQAQLGEMHALDYKVYAHLQRGDDDAAWEIVEHVARVSQDLHWENGVVAFNGGAVPVRWAMERHAWDEAAALPLADDITGEGYEARATVALRHWARAVGAARGGNPSAAREDLAHVERIAAEVKDHPNVWARNTTEVLRLEAAAWIALAEGDGDGGLDLMRQAASIEDQTAKSALSPGRVLPVHEQLGDLLMELGQPEEAHREYASSLIHAARRFNSLYGMARSARQAGMPEAAARAYTELLGLVSADSKRPEVAEAESYLASGG